MKSWPAICFASLLAFSQHAVAEGRLDAKFQELKTRSSTMATAAGSELRFIMSNVGDAPVVYNIQAYPVPNSRGFFSNNLLKVVGPDGKEAAYIGSYAEFEDDDRFLPAGKTEIHQIDIAKNYDVQPGVQYQISLRYPPVFFNTGEDTHAKSLKSLKIPIPLNINGVSASYTQKALDVSRNSQSLLPTAHATDVACDSTQTGQFNSGLAIAAGNASEALNTTSFHYTYDFSTSPATAYFHYWSRYWRWYGAHQDPVPQGQAQNSDSLVDQGLIALYVRTDGQAESPISITCDCADYSTQLPEDKPFAYVHKNELYVVHLCSKFWNSPQVAQDPELAGQSKTLYHEFTHFSDLYFSGTDHVIGADGKSANNMTQAEALVAASSISARANAYNWVYFIQNWDNQ